VKWLVGGFVMPKEYHRLVRHNENEILFLAVELSVLAAVSPTSLHLHAEGLRGTGKTSILRAARDVLPSITRITDCLYNCDPVAPHCPEHRGLRQEDVAILGQERIAMPYLEISHSAKMATVVGSLDLKRLTDKRGPEAAMLPGILAQAHRGVVFIDEINRLADTNPEIADVLLDVMGTKPGRLQIEEVGLPRVELPIKVTVWAASNPDEDPGPLDGIRRQLSDRFDLSVGVKRPSDTRVLAQILLLADEAHHASRQVAPRANARRMETLAPPVELPPPMVDVVAKLFVEFGLESIRAAESILVAARMHCARREARRVELSDICAGASLALRHRVAPEVLSEILAQLKQKGHGASAVPRRHQGTSPRDALPESTKTAGGLFSRLREVFKEPASMARVPNVGTYTPEGNLAARQQTYDLRAVGSAESARGDAAVVAPPLPARHLADIPVATRVQTEEDLGKK
jgi:magnesium chelatase subunit I